jgi:hypothetical protein
MPAKKSLIEDVEYNFLYSVYIYASRNSFKILKRWGKGKM